MSATNGIRGASARRKPGWVLVAGVLLVCFSLYGWYFARGTWATANPTYPTKPEDGVISNLVLNAEGRREIHTAVVIPVPVATAWGILSNYKEWERLFKTVHERKPTEPLPGNQHHVVSDVQTPLGVLQLDFIVTHEPTDNGGYRATWDAPTKELPSNRGSIQITPLGPDNTLLVYVVEKQYRRYPQFLVYNALYEHQADIVATLRARMLEVAKQK